MSQDSKNKEVLEALDELLLPEVRFYWDFRFAASNYFWIVNKHKRKVKFVFNTLQERLFRMILDEYPIRDLIIKARKFGISTFFLLLYYWDCITAENTTSTIIAHEKDPAKDLFRIIDYTHERLDPRFKPKTSLDNVRQMVFPALGSEFFIGSAMNKRFGRGATINNLHCSELAFWDNAEDLLGAATSEAVPEESGNIIIETTPSRLPYLRELINECKNDPKPSYNYRFFAWHEFPEYKINLDNDETTEDIKAKLTDEEKVMQAEYGLTWEQMKFWVTKRKKLKRKVWQEYPSDDIKCFQSTDKNSYFDSRQLQLLYLVVKNVEPIEIRDNGNIIIYKRPQPGKRYLISSDTSSGTEGGAWSAAVGLEYENADQVFAVRAHYSPPQLARILATLGIEYFFALIAVERNNHGHSVLNTLQNQLQYPNLYYHIDEEYDEWLRKRSGIGKIKKSLGRNPFDGKLGWPTDAKTKPVMFDQLRDEIIDEVHAIIRSARFIEECFEVKEKDGVIYSEDFMDEVIAWCIAWQVRKRIPSSSSVSFHTAPTASTKEGKQSKLETKRNLELPWNSDREEALKRKVEKGRGVAMRNLGSSKSNKTSNGTLTNPLYSYENLQQDTPQLQNGVENETRNGTQYGKGKRFNPNPIKKLKAILFGEIDNEDDTLQTIQDMQTLTGNLINVQISEETKTIKITRTRSVRKEANLIKGGWEL